MIHSKRRRIRIHRKKQSKRKSHLNKYYHISSGGSSFNELSSRSTPLKKICLFIIYGMGCSLFKKEDIENIQKYYHNLSKNKIPIDDIYWECHHKHLAPIRGIACSIFETKPMNNSTFLQNLCGNIKNKCNEYENILICGFSYGGLIANRIAEELNSTYNAIFSKIFISTFGSIYISPPDSINQMNIINYISIGDVAEKCNHIEMKKYVELKNIIRDTKTEMLRWNTNSTNKNVIDMCITTTSNPLCEKGEITTMGKVFGTKEQWTIHTNYDKLVELLLLNQTNDIRMCSNVE